MEPKKFKPTEPAIADVRSVVRSFNKPLCNRDCNHCPIILHPNSRMVTYILNQLHDLNPNKVYPIVENACPNLTVCYDCRIDDFCHVEKCELVE